MTLTSFGKPQVVGTRAKKLRSVPSMVISVSTIVALLLTWFLVTNTGLVGPNYLPSPQALLQQFGVLLQDGYQGRSLWEHIGASLTRTLVGFAIGSLIGVIIGLAAGSNRVISAALSPIMAFIRPIPPIAFIPMVVLYFGLGETGKIVLITVTAFNYAVVNAQAGASGVPIAYRRAAATLGIGKYREFFHVIFPAALPSIFAGLKVALALSWAVVVAAELVGAQKGLGYMINNAALLFQIPTVFIGIILIGIIGLLMNLTLALVESKLVHWLGRG
ncbi:ABC transporter permease [Arthrobacter sp. MYb229]|uniref:ABC transporter permease n=1 Tax=unclassified Arthrobacter TaxID=235627 RepID=UPI000CFD4BB5|nr:MULTISPECIES: ABC transporter permease [unclassified Arthrobacter]PRA06919.1 ABC transporter permease [Arthrobacter sp. MYb229]PRB47867.1 ABC transporter permease [Arthrobacter sp. MYb216]